MTHPRRILIIIVANVVVYILSGCRSASEEQVIETEPTPSIVWSDDFEDGNLDGWDIFYQGNFVAENGALSSKGEGDIYHLSTVLSGTWSFDLYLISDYGLTHEVQFTEGGTNYQMISVQNLPNTQIWISTQIDPEDARATTIDLGEILTGWHHFDITRESSGLIKVYLDGQYLLEHSDDRPFNVESLTIYYCCSGPVLDNMVVQDQIIEIPFNE